MGVKQSESLSGITGIKENTILSFQEDERVKTLGVSWVPNKDVIQYNSVLKNFHRRVTKRTILSHVAQVFDPLGLVGPMVVIAKMLLQELWKLNIGWDEAVPQDLCEKWKTFVDELGNLVRLKIPRWVVIEQYERLEVHGFSDASEKAYGACIYLVSVNFNQSRQSFLLASKSRIAPIKVITLARLELCAALLMVQLVNRIVIAVRKNIDQIVYYTDSMIVLSWVRACPSKFKTFVSHRIGEIQTLIKGRDWKHVSSAENPADIISRGAFPSALVENDLWWHGPKWLVEGEYVSYECGENVIGLPEAKTLVVKIEAEDNCVLDLTNRYSNLERLVRVVALCKRFIFNLKNKGEKRGGHLSADELSEAELNVVKLVQKADFGLEIKAFKGGKSLPNTSRILSMSPFLDEWGILRVGGRLSHSSLEYDTKHPILLPNRNTFTDLIIRREHYRLLHGGMQTTLASLRQRYWPIAGRSCVRKVLRNCIVCFRAKPKFLNPIMGELPKARVQVSRPFQNTGVDYFGPLYIKEGSRRSKRIKKCYGAIFICMATRAVHIECVSDLTTEAFLAALRRFFARRGCAQTIFSDNGTNFKGADNELARLFEAFGQEAEAKKITDSLSMARVKWHFIPPRAPHFGGLWESAVKSAKHHIHRVVKESYLTFEEMHTFLAQVESVLNSRPLCSLSEDPNDLSILTPGHFLIGTSLSSIPDPALADVPMNRLTRWLRIQKLQQAFWKRWSEEFLTSLQVRSKWTTSKTPNVREGQLVLVRNENLPPHRWRIGRIQEIHQGQDGVVRAATVRTSSEVLVRPVRKLCSLPLGDCDTNSSESF